MGQAMNKLLGITEIVALIWHCASWLGDVLLSVEDG
jgi:hypothetical protein